MENTEISTDFEQIPPEKDCTDIEDSCTDTEETSPIPDDSASIYDTTVEEEPDMTEALRQELSSLKAHIEEQRVKEERALCELEEFSRLYPDTDVSSIDATVWEKVEKGLPLSAAYALFEREEMLKKRLADEVNLRNNATSAGSAGSSPRLEYFSPDEVRAMSGDEVRQNYANIRRSMDYWRNVKK